MVTHEVISLQYIQMDEIEVFTGKMAVFSCILPIHLESRACAIPKRSQNRLNYINFFQFRLPTELLVKAKIIFKKFCNSSRPTMDLIFQMNYFPF